MIEPTEHFKKVAATLPLSAIDVLISDFKKDYDARSSYCDGFIRGALGVGSIDVGPKDLAPLAVYLETVKNVILMKEAADG